MFHNISPRNLNKIAYPNRLNATQSIICKHQQLQSCWYIKIYIKKKYIQIYNAFKKYEWRERRSVDWKINFQGKKEQ